MVSFASTPSPSPDTRGLVRWFTSVRQSGLLAALSPESWQVLCALLSFLTREGQCRFTEEQLAFALGLSREEVGRWLEALAGEQWNGEPLLIRELDTHGEVCGVFLTSPDMFTALAPQEGGIPASVPDPSPPGQQTARPPCSEYPSGKSLEEQLVAVGLYPDQIDRLLDGNSPEQIQCQLEWLPFRRANNPAAYLVRAIEGNWAAPREYLRLGRPRAESKKAPSEELTVSTGAGEAA